MSNILNVIKDKYQNDYTETAYKNKRTKISYICPTHGIIEQLPINHLKIGCPYCSRGSDNSYSFAAKVKHDVTNIKYKNFKSMVEFECPKHGTQEQLPKTLLNKGCLKCIGQNYTKKHTKESILEKIKEQHGEKYTYPNLKFDSVHDKIEIICPEHGMFKQQIWAHVNGQGCRTCGYIERKINKKTTEEFIIEAKAKYGNHCDYSKVNLNKITTHDPISVICHKHGEFVTAAHLHLHQCIYPCPQCARESSTSIAENEVYEFVKSEYDGIIQRNDRKVLYGREIDVYLPELKLGIEYHGLYYHTEKMVGKNYHMLKADLADKRGIHLLQIFENEWNDKIKSIIKGILGKSDRIYARNTQVVELSIKDKNKFLNDNHMQGEDRSSIKLGLLYNDEIVSCMTFGKPRFDNTHKWEMIRYCSKMGVNVVGGASKIFKHFTNSHPGSVISYVNRRWFNGSMYPHLGFRTAGNSDPGYFYYGHVKVLSRYQCQKHKLKKTTNYSDDKTGYEIMMERGYDRVWDAGNLRFEYE